MPNLDNIMDRYQRQILLDEIGLQGQAKLHKARVLIVGCGGLGGVISLYLTGAGIGKLGLVDFDNVTLNNLHRQIVYRTNDIGNLKVICAKNNLSELNPETEIETFSVAINTNNIIKIAQNYDILVDGLDNSASRYVLDDASKALKKPFVYGGIDGYIGQVGVFNYQNGAAYSNLFPKNGSTLNATITGVLGVLPGIIGCLQANEVLKIITGFGKVLSGKLLEYDIRTNSQMIYNIT